MHDWTKRTLRDELNRHYTIHPIDVVRGAPVPEDERYFTDYAVISDNSIHLCIDKTQVF